MCLDHQWRHVVDRMTPRQSEHPHGLSDKGFDILFTKDKPIIDMPEIRNWKWKAALHENRAASIQKQVKP